MIILDKFRLAGLPEIYLSLPRIKCRGKLRQGLGNNETREKTLEDKVMPKPMNKTHEKTTCFHCGDTCPTKAIHMDEKYFCCNGCKTAFQILSRNEMCAYYTLEDHPGITIKHDQNGFRFSYLDNEEIKKNLLDFTDGTHSTITLYIPSIHCSSCIWVLENLFRLNPAILASNVNFLRRELALTYQEEKITLRDIFELLSAIGYEPQVNLQHAEEQRIKDTQKELYIKLGVAGFCFGNIMLLSFPEYLDFFQEINPSFKNFLSYLTILLSFPVLFYSSLDYFKSAFTSLRQKAVNMDIPISLGIITLFTRSLYDIIILKQNGFMDSFAGLIFLLLLGKLFERKTYDALSFERDYKSYFPISVLTVNAGEESYIPLASISAGNRLIIKNNEIIPADSVLIKGEANIDYSFVTGESRLDVKKSGDIIYAGGKQTGGAIELEAIKKVSQSYLTQLWNNDAFIKPVKGRLVTIADRVSKYFTITVISVATAAALYWLPVNTALALNAFTAVLIVACPCALALSTPFTLGNTLRIFGKFNFYLKNIATIETLARINAIVFDKTGTLTYSGQADAKYIPIKPLTNNEKIIIKSLARHSSHPLSQCIYQLFQNLPFVDISDYQAITGKGIEGTYKGTHIKIGSANYLNIRESLKQTAAYVEINGILKGYFQIGSNYRPGMNHILEKLKKRFELYLLSGDNDHQRNNIEHLFQQTEHIYFSQSPLDKLKFIKKLQSKNQKVLMIGDGLNDAGALQQSNAGIAIAENTNAFSPACDAILTAEKFDLLPAFLKFSRSSMHVITMSFIISFLYNVIGLYFAVQGTLSPLIAAILMPLSSITVVVFTTGMTKLWARKSIKV
jgi:Cu+-exporting ATPase